METDGMSHPCCLTCTTQPSLPLTWTSCSQNADWSLFQHVPRLLAVKIIGWHTNAKISGCTVMCFKVRETALEGAISALRAESSATAKHFNLLEENLAARARRWTGQIFIFWLPIIPSHILWQKLQENICHGFKRFISFKAEEAGRATRRRDHAILPARVWAYGQNSPAKLPIQSFHIKLGEAHLHFATDVSFNPPQTTFFNTSWRNASIIANYRRTTSYHNRHQPGQR